MPPTDCLLPSFPPWSRGSRGWRRTSKPTGGSSPLWLLAGPVRLSEAEVIELAAPVWAHTEKNCLVVAGCGGLHLSPAAELSPWSPGRCSEMAGPVVGLPVRRTVL
jgi:hypothetical protein